MIVVNSLRNPKRLPIFKAASSKECRDFLAIDTARSAYIKNETYRPPGGASLNFDVYILLGVSAVKVPGRNSLKRKPLCA
jgi:hypothetical protein